MKKIIEIDGMHCEKCKARVEKALNELNGVSAKVNLAKKNAVASVNSEITDELLEKTVTKLGFSVVSISLKKGIFG